MKDEFYIGYLEKMPEGIARFVRKTIILIFIVSAGIALILSLHQRGFLKSTYEYYQDTELTGYLLSEPVPALQVSWGYGPSQNPLIQTIPIVAFGKKGGKDLIKDFINTNVVAKGKLIYYDGKALLELSQPDAITPQVQTSYQEIPLANIEYGKSTQFRGEIVDAKCFFGVMKPGHGKPHRSCAIRCISGGIPAVFRSEGTDGPPDYHLIVGQAGEPVSFLGYVGEYLEVTGVEGEFNDWKVLIVESIHPLAGINYFDRGIAFCGKQGNN